MNSTPPALFIHRAFTEVKQNRANWSAKLCMSDTMDLARKYRISNAWQDDGAETIRRDEPRG
jgi:hypothetical protein